MIEEILNLLGTEISQAQLDDLAVAFKESPIVSSISDDTYVSFEKNGFSLLIRDNGRLATVHLYLEPDSPFSAYAHDLPFGMSPDASREEIRSMLGEPSKSGTLGRGLLGVTPPWDRFSFPSRSVHVQYSTDATRIELVTIMAPEDTPS